MKRHLHEDFQKITEGILERAGKLSQQNLFDEILPRLVFPKGTTQPLAATKAAYFPSSCTVAYVSGDRSTGAVLSIAEGIGFKRAASNPDADKPLFEPIVVASTFNLAALANSDPTNDRIDRIFMRPKENETNNVLVDLINPATEVVTSTLADQDATFTYETVVATGTPAGSPTPPTTPVGWSDDDEIAEVLVQSGSGAIAADDITDKRTELRLATDLEPDTRPATDITTAAPLPVSDVQTELERIDAKALLKGYRVGVFTWVNATTVRLARALEGSIWLELDGELRSQSSDLDFDMASDFEATRSESPSEWLYAYVHDNAGTMVPHISDTPPVTNPAGKVGYHPGTGGGAATWRFVGAFYNDSGSDILAFDEVSKDEYQFRRHDAAFQLDLGVTTPATWQAITLTAKIPRLSRAAHLLHDVTCDDAHYWLGHADFIGESAPGGNPPSGNESPLLQSYDMGNSVTRAHSTLAWISMDRNDATPQAAWATANDSGVPARHKQTLRIVGWRF